MADREQDHPISGHTSVIEGLARLEQIREERAPIAFTAARYVAEELGGETLDPALYYAAMFGRSATEAAYEHDPNYLVPRDIVSKLTHASEPGQPLLVRSVDFPDDNVEVGVVDSFSKDVFKPVRFEVAIEETPPGFHSWRGALSLAIRKVEYASGGQKGDFELSLAVSKIEVYDTATWFTEGHGGLEIHTKGTGGVEVGDAVTYSDRPGVKGHQQKAFWLRELLAPTERKPLSPQLQTLRKRHIEDLQTYASEAGIDVAQMAAQALSPTINNFFTKVEPYVIDGVSEPINVPALFSSWRDPYDAQSLLAELEFLGLVEENSDGQLVVSDLGRETMTRIERL